MLNSTPLPEARTPAPGQRARQGLVMMGLFTTFIALSAIALALPSDIAFSGSGLGLLTLGSVGLFIGGGLLGYAAGARGARRR